VVPLIPPVLRLACLFVLIATAGGCRLLSETLQVPGKVASAATGGEKKPMLDPRLAQVQFMRYGDAFALEISRATREFAALAGTPEAQIQALSWKLQYTDRMWRLASGPHPYIGLFDAAVMIGAVRRGHEKRWLEKWGEADRPMIDAIVRLEESLWAVARQSLTEDQLNRVRSLVDEWLAGDADRVSDVTMLPGFVDLENVQSDKGSIIGDLTDLIRLDPLGGLEPAVREVAEARQLAERTVYYLQRMPDLMSTRIELQVLRSSRTEEVQFALASVERVSEAAKSIAATAAGLPAEVRAERETAIAQLSAEIDAQREALVHDLEKAREPLKELLEESRGTLEAGKTLSDSLTVTVKAVDELMERFPTEEKVPGAPADPPGRPFDITEYGVAAERIGVAVRELGATIETLDKSLPQLQRALDEAADRGERTVDHAFARAYGFLAATLGGILVVVLLARWISPRLRAPAKS
jgi:hypothetical protein